MMVLGQVQTQQQQQQQQQQHAQAFLARGPSADSYFAEDPGLIAAFDFDYDTIVSFETSLQWTRLLTVPPFLVLGSLCCVPCFLTKNIGWTTRAQHVALTVDGIRYVKDRHPSCCGFPCSDVGKISKTVPYDKITDCDVKEPAGTACCCCVQNVLYEVHVDTASSGTKDGVPAHELVLKGLSNAVEFKQAVWAVKRGELPAARGVNLGAMPLSAPRSAEGLPPRQAMMGGEDAAGVLCQIRDELKQQTTELQKMNALLQAKA
jgi:hypothetical protein